MPLISPAKLNGIIRRDGEVCIRMATLNTTGIKIATTPVELINAPSPATVSLNKTNILISLLPATLTSHVPITVASPVRTKPSPIINKAAIRTKLGSEKPENTTGTVSVPLNANATITKKKTPHPYELYTTQTIQWQRTVMKELKSIHRSPLILVN